MEPPAKPTMEASSSCESPWLGETEAHARPARARIFELFGLRPPQVAEGASAPAQRNREDDDTYKALVGEMGY